MILSQKVRNGVNITSLAKKGKMGICRWLKKNGKNLPLVRGCRGGPADTPRRAVDRFAPTRYSETMCLPNPANRKINNLVITYSIVEKKLIFNKNNFQNSILEIIDDVNFCNFKNDLKKHEKA